jgi:hypothetical protein
VTVQVERLTSGAIALTVTHQHGYGAQTSRLVIPGQDWADLVHRIHAGEAGSEPLRGSESRAEPPTHPGTPAIPRTAVTSDLRASAPIATNPGGAPMTDQPHRVDEPSSSRPV